MELRTPGKFGGQERGLLYIYIYIYIYIFIYIYLGIKIFLLYQYIVDLLLKDKTNWITRISPFITSKKFCCDLIDLGQT